MPPGRLKGSLATQLGEAVASMEQKDSQLKHLADLEEQLATFKEKYSQLEKVKGTYGTYL